MSGARLRPASRSEFPLAVDAIRKEYRIPHPKLDGSCARGCWAMCPEMPLVSLRVQCRVAAEPVLAVERLSQDLRARPARPLAVGVDVIDGDVDPALPRAAGEARIVAIAADHEDARAERELGVL